MSPTAPEQAELGSTTGLALLQVMGLELLCYGTSPNYFRQPEAAVPGAAQEPPAAFLG